MKSWLLIQCLRAEYEDSDSVSLAVRSEDLRESRDDVAALRDLALILPRGREKIAPSLFVVV